MNSNQQKGKDERQFEAGLDQLERLYRSADKIEPPDLVDQAILNKARRAVAAKNSWLDFGWIHAVTTVALVVLTFSIFTTQRQTGEFEPITGKSLERSPGKVTGQLSEQPSQQPESERAESSQAASTLAESAKVRSTAAGTGRAVTEQDDAADQSMSDQAAPPVTDAAGAPVSEPALKASRKEAREDIRATDQQAAQQQMRAPASAAPVPSPAAPLVDNAEAFSKKKHSDLDSLDAPQAAAETEIISIDRQQQLLDRILALKHAGNELWTEELASFIKLYPDFPLPAELQSEARQNKD